ncbi:MAG: mannose-1-phosphate guanylyltransferase [Bacteroidetes bacterium]|nr:mannose-1-phosphate guanylyltransferase [Bacteroidota bacterium]
MNNNYCVIMAGGIGSRFWPMSRNAFPKQFLDILGTGKTLLQQTYDRFLKACPKENIYVVTNEAYVDLVLKQLPDLLPSQVLGEPHRKNTAPCIAYASYKISKLNPNAKVVVAPSDHVILKEDEFIKTILKGLDFVSKNDSLLTLGIRPNRPDTGYGYIQFIDDKIQEENKISKVKTFTEKPNLEMAKFFLQTGEFLWNAGIFLWSVGSIHKAISEHIPEMDSLFHEAADHFNEPDENEFVRKAYEQCTNISIDFGVMEKARNVYVMSAEFGWSDLGTYGSLYEHIKHDASENAIVGKNVLVYDSKNCIINMPKDKLVVVQGLDDYIVVESEGVLLICKKQDEQQIRQFVNDVKLTKGDKFI